MIFLLNNFIYTVFNLKNIIISNNNVKINYEIFNILNPS